MKHNRKNNKRYFTFFIFCFCIICALGIHKNQIKANAAVVNENLPSDTTETENTEFTTPDSDMSTITLEKTSVTAYLVPTYTYGKTVIYGNAELDIAVNSPVILNETTPGVNFSCKSSNKKVRTEVSLSDNILHFKFYGNQNCKTKLTVSIADKNFKINVSVKTVKISDSSLLLEKGRL